MVGTDKPFARESGPWSLPNNVTEWICRYAGRESSAVLYVAIGPYQKAGVVARKAIYYEPFTYWDWHGVHPDEKFTGARGLKRQLLWERQRGYRREGHNSEIGYPSPRERWQSFKTVIAGHEQRCLWVRHIAVAHWMDENDLDWISRHFSKLESLDLSDAAVRDTENAASASSSELKNSNTLGELQVLLGKLRWLGIPDTRAPGPKFREVFPIQRYLSMCNALHTLCIRDTRDSDMRPYSFESAEAAWHWVAETITSIPATTTNLELRMCQPLIDHLIAEFLEQKSAIRHIGVDLGAWTRTQSPTTNQADQSGTIKYVAALAYQTTLEQYEKEHNKVFHPKSKWWLPSFLSPADRDPGQDDRDARPAFTENLYRHQYIMASDDNGPLTDRNWMAIPMGGKEDATIAKDGLGSLTFISLYENIHKLYRGAICGQGSIRLYPLTQEWQVNSTEPIQPLAMIRPRSGDKDMLTEQLTEMYDWLNNTFNWRPVFDWDCFMKHDFPYGRDSVIGQIAQQLQLMRNAQIPIKILIGRRHIDLSSLYWGCDEAAWADAMSKPFNKSLDQIAPLVDALIIHYDLRNPLSHDHLQDIDEEEPYIGPAAVCPRSLCPWTSKECPFEKQWHKRPIARTATGGSPAVFNSRAKSKYPPRLASSNIAWLSTGEDADLHPSDDYDPANAHGQPTLHKLARHAAYLREAVCWQRFWTEYAADFRNLSELHVRMPRNFDKICNLRLRQLLDPRDGWKMHTFAEERQHMQTREDLEWEVGSRGPGLTHLPEMQIWPGGSFVRRLWVRMGAPPPFKELALERANEDGASLENSAACSALDNVSEDEIERIERVELERATKMAETAGQKEDDYRKKLEAAKSPSAREKDPDLMSDDADWDTELGAKQQTTRIRGLTANDRRNRQNARNAWLIALQDHAHNISDKNIETVLQHDLHRSSNDIKTIAEDAIKIRKVLQDTRKALERMPSLFLDNALQCPDPSPSIEVLTKTLEEKRAAPMAKQLLEKEAREAEIKDKNNAATAATSPSPKARTYGVPAAISEVSDTQREIPETQPSLDEFVLNDPPEQGIGSSQSFAQPPEALDDNDLDSLFGESLEPEGLIDLTATDLAVPPPLDIAAQTSMSDSSSTHANPPPVTTIQMLGGDGPIDLTGNDFWDVTDGNGDVAVLRFPNTIPETIDVDQFSLTTQTVGSQRTGLGTSILGTARVQCANTAAPDAKTSAEEVIIVESATTTQPASQQGIVVDQVTQIERQILDNDAPGPDEIVITTETPDIATIQDTQSAIEIPESPHMIEPLTEDPSPTPSPPATKALSKKPPRPLRAARAPGRELPESVQEPEKPATRKRTRNTRSTTPAVGSRQSTRSVTPVSYKGVNSYGDEQEDGDERPKKKRKAAVKNVKKAAPKKAVTKKGAGGKGKKRGADEVEEAGEEEAKPAPKKRMRKKKGE